MFLSYSLIGVAFFITEMEVRVDRNDEDWRLPSGGQIASSMVTSIIIIYITLNHNNFFCFICSELRVERLISLVHLVFSNLFICVIYKSQVNILAKRKNKKKRKH